MGFSIRFLDILYFWFGCRTAVLTEICVEYDAQISREEERGDQTPELREWEFKHPWDIEHNLVGADKAKAGRYRDSKRQGCHCPVY